MRGIRISTVATSVVVLGLSATSALADAPDVKVPPNQTPLISAQVVENTGDGHAGTPADPHTVTVTVTGGWSWSTHGKDCNTDRAGAGVAVDWFDPNQPGNPLGNTDATAKTVLINGVATPIFVGAKDANSLNSADNVVHPTENDTGSGAVADVAAPASFADWRGGCGVFSSDTLLNGTTADTAHGNFGNVAPGDTDAHGNPFDSPTAPADAAQRGATLSHVYRSKSDVTKLCAITYDVHSGKNGTKASDNDGVGIPDAAKEITAGGSGRNDDNGAEKNANTPAGNACPAFSFPTLTTTASADTQVNNTISDTAHLTGTAPGATGSISFELYNDAACTTRVNGATPPSQAVNGDGDYGGPLVNGFTPTVAGTYHWRAFYSGDPATGTAAVSTPCNDTNENVNVAPGPQPLASPPPIGQQQVLGQEIVHGAARLSGATGCVARKFTVKVSGQRISKVVITIDGKRKATLTRANGAGAFTYRVNPRKYRAGSHLLVARSEFAADSQTAPKTMKLRFARCVRHSAPAFTG